MTILKEAQLAIASWEEVRTNNRAILNYLNQGSYFIIPKLNYQIWHENVGNLADASLHAYMGLSMLSNATNPSLSLYCVDSVTDSLPVVGNEDRYGLSLKKCVYSDGQGDGITGYNIDAIDTVTIEALKSIFRWNLGKSSWVDAAIGMSRMVQVFHIPFKDLKKLFDNNPSVNEVLVVFALKDMGGGISNIDLILWGYDQPAQLIAQDPEDIIKPCPPFGGEESAYQLLNSLFSL